VLHWLSTLIHKYGDVLLKARLAMYSDRLAAEVTHLRVPRESPFEVNLSGEERRELESITRKYTSPYCDVIRAKIILSCG
jgi:hypothetical protein